MQKNAHKVSKKGSHRVGKEAVSKRVAHGLKRFVAISLETSGREERLKERPGKGRFRTPPIYGGKRPGLEEGVYNGGRESQRNADKKKAGKRRRNFAPP